MPKQKGIIPIEGTIDNITFFKTKEGYMARKKGGVSAERIAKDPKFSRTRENMAEFSRAGKAGQTLCKALRSIIQGSTDTRMVGRLTRLMMAVLKLDAVNPRGQRGVIDGEAALLEGFEFNKTGKLGTTFLAAYAFDFDRETGVALFDAPPFVPTVLLYYPRGSTHFRIRTAAALVNFEAGAGKTKEAASAYLPINSEPTAALSLSMQLEAASSHPAFLVVSIEFVQETNGAMYPLQTGQYNACTIVKVDTGV